jgi:putative phosphoesterase
MKILIVSDIHGNWPALQAVLAAEPDADHILCLGDLVNYGPHPAECVRWAMDVGSTGRFIQGNHDRAFGCDETPHCSPAYQLLAESMQVATSHLLAPEIKHYLAELQPQQRFQFAGAKCAACHATPTDPLYHYLGEESGVTLWESELVRAGHPDFLFVGHTHVPMKTQFQRTQVVNPGSVGQPKHGDPRAAYAIWSDGVVSLRRTVYDVEQTIRAFSGLALEPHVARSLSEVLRTGGNLPREHSQENFGKLTYEKT